MDLTPYVTGLRRDLVTAAEAGSEDIRAAAERLALAIDPAARLVLMEVLADAASEITADLPQGSVEVRLAGREVELVVDPGVPAPPAAPVPPAPPTPPTPPAPEAEDDGSVARVSLRLPESLKQQAESRAADAGQSLNTWLVAAVRSAAHRGVVNVDIDLSSLPLGAADPFQRRNRRLTGWS
ncbi:pilus assembly protein HicB [Nocardioides zeae]|uniref:Pilus assembly protein HicB n=1 Tax=Nocardioides imazamoxiresistens TaxID=3231893 RepID=A0ABU3PVU2_9ACTN|nr:pilus assembly protein HicB [Nocardioides zeae]MDT9593358.1 pilus assembly protein HicB [Nocardioides zeae]